jgi:hypothetical protein
MTESEWDNCNDPAAMLELIKGRASERKLRLFARACVGLYASYLTDARSKRAVEVAERVADGAGEESSLRIAEQDAKAAIPSLTLNFRPSEQAAAAGAMAVVNIEAAQAARLACGWGRNVKLALALEQETGDMSRAENKAFADWGAEAVALLVDILGNPSRPMALVPPWQTPQAVDLARSMYDNRDFTQMPELAKLLEAAGCSDAGVLEHCRGQGPHVRGCWLVDSLLGKE